MESDTSSDVRKEIEKLALVFVNGAGASVPYTYRDETKRLRKILRELRAMSVQDAEKHLRQDYEYRVQRLQEDRNRLPARIAHMQDVLGLLQREREGAGPPEAAIFRRFAIASCEGEIKRCKRRLADTGESPAFPLEDPQTWLSERLRQTKAQLKKYNKLQRESMRVLKLVEGLVSYFNEAQQGALPLPEEQHVSD